MMYSEPNFSLGIEHTTQVAPGHRKVWLSLYGFQVTSLQLVYIENHRKGGQEVEWDRYSMQREERGIAK